MTKKEKKIYEIIGKYLENENDRMAVKLTGSLYDLSYEELIGRVFMLERQLLDVQSSSNFETEISCLRKELEHYKQKVKKYEVFLAKFNLQLL